MATRHEVVNSRNKVLTAEEFKQVLEVLDKELGKSKNIRKVSPIKLLAVGGYVSVTYLKNRESTEDIDFILDPQTKNQKKILEKLFVAVEKVAELKDYPPDWFNDKVAQFAVGETRLPLFQESVAQNLVLWQGENLIIYAVKWEWSLARKLKRIGSTNREVDISDAVAILHEINSRNGSPLEWHVAKSWNTVVYSPIEDHVLNEVARRYKVQYGQEGLVGSAATEETS